MNTSFDPLFLSTVLKKCSRRLEDSLVYLMNDKKENLLSLSSSSYIKKKKKKKRLPTPTHQHTRYSTSSYFRKYTSNCRLFIDEDFFLSAKHNWYTSAVQWRENTHTHTDGGRCLCEMILMYICRWKEKYVQGRTEVFRTKAKKSFRLPCQYRVIRKCNVREKFVFFLFSSFSSSYYFNSCPMILIEHLRNPFYVDIISLKNNV